MRSAGWARVSSPREAIYACRNGGQAGEIDPTFVISHVLPLEDAPAAYQMFRDKQDGCTKVVLKP